MFILYFLLKTLFLGLNIIKLLYREVIIIVGNILLYIRRILRVTLKNKIKGALLPIRYIVAYIKELETNFFDLRNKVIIALGRGIIGLTNIEVRYS